MKYVPQSKSIFQKIILTTSNDLFIETSNDFYIDIVWVDPNYFADKSA